MTEDPRCCGTGTCIINEEGLCWCGQSWNGESMCFPKLEASMPVDDQTAENSTPVASPGLSDVKVTAGNS
jgi:hypothetical protein